MKVGGGKGAGSVGGVRLGGVVVVTVTVGGGSGSSDWAAGTPQNGEPSEEVLASSPGAETPPEPRVCPGCGSGSTESYA